MSDEIKRPSILSQANDIVGAQPDGVEIGAVMNDGDVGAQASGKVDIGKPGGWSVGATWQWMREKGTSAAALLRWMPKPPARRE